MKKINVEVEGSELLIQSKEGHYAVIPAKHRQEVMDMVKDGCDDCVNNYIQTLPKDSDYAQDGSLLPDDPPTIKDMERARYMSVAPIGKVKTMDDIAIESMEKSKNHPFTTYVAPKLSSVQKQTTVQPALKTNPEQEAKDRASKEEDNRTPQQKKMDEEYQERINNPTTRDFIGDVLQYPLRAIANPFGVIGDFVDIGTSISQEQIEYNKYMLDPYRTDKEKSDMRFNTATRLTKYALLNTLPVEVVAGNMIKSGKNLIKPVSKVVNKVDDIAKPITSYVDDVGSLFKGTLTGKEKEMYRWFEEQQKLNALPKTTNKKTLGVLEDFKTRIQTPEGKKRMKELGIDSDEMLQKIQTVEDPTTFGYFSGGRNRAVLNPLDPLPTHTARHEIEHGVQSAFQKQAIKNEGKIIPTFKKLFTDPLLKKPLPKSITDANTKIDDLLSGLELKKQGTPNKQWRGHVEHDSPVDISEYKSLISNRQNATDYFLTGSEGREKSAFLGEVQQYMMDNNIIPKTSYIEVTPEMVKNTFINAMFDETGGGKYLRLFNIMKPSEANYKLISEGLNKMLGLIPTAIGTGTVIQSQNNKKK